MSFADLPNDVLKIIVLKYARHVTRNRLRQAAKAIVHLSATSKDLKVAIDRGVWLAAWETYQTHETYIANETRKPSSDPQRDFILHTQVGCQFCKLPRIRKVHAEFGVRCCKDCLYARTISDYRLESTYLVDVSRLRSPFTERELWNSQGTYALKFFWTSSVERELGRSLDDHCAIETERRRERQRTQREAYTNRLRADARELASTFGDHLDAEEAPEFRGVVESLLSSSSSETKTTARKVVDDAILVWNGRKLDNNLRRKARARRISIVDARRTGVYKAKIAARDPRGAMDFTDGDWERVEKEVFDITVARLLRKHDLVELDLIRHSEMYRAMKQEFKVPPPEEWLRAVEEKRNMLEQARLEKERLKKERDGIMSSISGHTKCTFCNRGLKSQHALKQHVIDAHINRDHWPLNNKPQTSSIEHQTSSIEPQTSSIEYQTSSLEPLEVV